MSVSNELQAYQARTKDALAIDASAFFGSIVTFELVDDDLAHAFVQDTLTQVHLDAYTPNPPADSDVFRRVFENGERRKFEFTEVDPADPTKIITKQERLLVRQVAFQKDTPTERGFVVKRIVSEFVNPTERSIHYPEQGGGEVVFSFETPHHLQMTTYPDATANAVALMAELQKQYDTTRGFVDGSAVRNVITRVLTAAHAIPLRGRSGGVSFVPITQEDLVDKLEQWAKLLPNAVIHSWPVLRDEKQEKFVLDNAIDDLTQDSDRLIVDIDKLLDSGEIISLSQWTSLSTKTQLVEGKTTDIEALLNHTALSTEVGLATVKQRLDALYARIERKLHWVSPAAGAAMVWVTEEVGGDENIPEFAITRAKSDAGEWTYWLEWEEGDEYVDGLQEAKDKAQSIWNERQVQV